MAGVDWKAQFAQDKASHCQSLVRLVENDAVVVQELLRDPEAPVEVLTLLRFHLTRHSGDHPAETIHLMEKLRNAAVRLSQTSDSGIDAVLSLPEWFLPRTEVQYDDEPFACGSFGSVHRGLWGSGARVVVKVFRVTAGRSFTASNRATFMKEADLWFDFRHPHVVKMIGACHVPAPPFIVCEDASNGDLARYLEASAENKKRMWRLLHQAALGLQYLHSKNVVHGDLKLNNILVSSDGQARVADFGLSVLKKLSSSRDLVGSALEAGERATGGLRWRAPECFTSKPTVQSDVFSFGMCLVEAVTGEPPHADLEDLVVTQLLQEGTIPPQPKEMTDDVWRLVLSMTHKEPTQRVTLATALEHLHKLTHQEQKALHDLTVVCTMCLTLLEEDSQYCSQCGSKVAAPKPVKVDNGCAATTNTMTTGTTTAVIIRSSIRNLLEPGPESQIVLALITLSKIASSTTANQNRVASCGGILPLSHVLHSRNDKIRGNAADVIAALTSENKSTQDALAAAGVVDVLSSWLLAETCDDRVKASAIAALSSLTSGGVPNRNQSVAKCAIGPLVGLLTHPMLDHSAVRALGFLVNGNASNQELAVSLDAIPVLVQQLANSNPKRPKCTREAAITLRRLASEHALHQILIATTAGAIPLLVELVATGSTVYREAIAWAIAGLACDNKLTQDWIVEAGAIEPLFKLVETGTLSEQDRAMLALMHLASNNLSNQDQIALAGGVLILVGLLSHSSQRLRRRSAWTLCELVTTNAHNKNAVVAAGGLAGLVQLLHESDTSVQRAALEALNHLTADHPQNAALLVGIGGAVSRLVDRLANGSKMGKIEAAFTLANVACTTAANHGIVRAHGVVPLLVKLLEGGTNKQKSGAAVALGKIWVFQCPNFFHQARGMGPVR